MNPLVLVHGFMGGSAQWQLQQEALGAGRKLVMPGLPGFGARADAPAITTMQGFAQSVIDDLDRQGVGRFDLLGHSMGGMVVQQIVRMVPERVASLVLYGTGAVGLLPGRFESIEESMARAAAEGVPATARRISATWFLHNEQAAQYQACAGIAAQTSAAAFDGGLRAMAAWSGTDHLAGIRLPVLVLWGDQDRTYPWAQPKKLWQEISGAGLAVVPGCAHAVHMEKPGLFNALVLDFLNRQA